MRVTRPSVVRTGLSKAAPAWALPAARANIRAAVAVVQPMPSGEWCGW
jgi:hypothetical protein